MGSGERSGKLAGLGERDDDSSSYRCTKKTTLHRQLQFSSSETQISCFGDGGNGTSSSSAAAAPAGGPIFFNSAGGGIYDAHAPLTGTHKGLKIYIIYLIFCWFGLLFGWVL